MASRHCPRGRGGLPVWERRLWTSLVDRIVSGELGPGTLLPTEPRLCEAFSVSRTVIREAVKILEQKGLVRIKQGQGTTVAVPDEWNLLDPVVLEASVRHDKDLRILDDLVEVRRVLESDMAGQAAGRATTADRADMKRLLDQLAVEVVTPERHMLTDLEFHDVIMRASGNRLGRAIVRTIQSEARASDRYNGYPEAGRLRSVRRRPHADLRPHRRGGRGGCGRSDVRAHSGLMARPQARAGAAVPGGAAEQARLSARLRAVLKAGPQDRLLLRRHMYDVMCRGARSAVRCRAVHSPIRHDRQNHTLPGEGSALRLARSRAADGMTVPVAARHASGDGPFRAA